MGNVMKKKRLAYVLMEGNAVRGVFSFKKDLLKTMETLRVFHPGFTDFLNHFKFKSEYKFLGTFQTVILNDSFWVKICPVGEFYKDKI